MPKRKTPEKKAPTRDRQKVVITPEELAEAERRLPEVIREYRAIYVGVKGKRDVEFKVLSASIEHESIHLSVVITGTVSDPTNTATAKGEMIPIRIPAKIERREIDEPTENNEPVAIPGDQPDDDFIPFPDIG